MSSNTLKMIAVIAVVLAVVLAVMGYRFAAQANADGVGPQRIKGSGKYTVCVEGVQYFYHTDRPLYNSDGTLKSCNDYATADHNSARVR